MKEQELMNLTDLESFFEENGSSYTNPNKVNFDLTEDLWISAVLWLQPPVCFELLYIVDEANALFVKNLGLTSTADIDRIDLEFMWAQYRKGNARICAGMSELFELNVYFQQLDGKTHVFVEFNKPAPEGGLKEIDVLHEVSEDINWFRAYIRDNAKRWYEFAEKAI